MKLQAVLGDTVYATRDRTVYAADGGGIDRIGRLPVPSGGVDGLRYRAKTTPPWRTAVTRVVGRFPVVNVWPTSRGTLVASADRWLLVSTDGGDDWEVACRLHRSSGPMGVLPTAFCEHDGALYLGEYPLAGSARPRLLRSVDGGRSWEPALVLEDVRHVHAVQSDPYGDDLWLTTGDAGEECRIGRVRDGAFLPVGGGDQGWRAVSLAFTPSAVLWGVDSVYAERNEIRAIDRADLDRTGRRRPASDGGRGGADRTPSPPVRTLGALQGSVYYSATLETERDRWVVLSTATEPGTDSTAPPGRRETHTDRARVVAAAASSGYEEWHELAAYDRRRVPADGRALDGRLPSANAYVFLGADGDAGLFVNPYNTARHDGDIRNYPPAYFERLG
ncbi:MAG: glycosyl hydrolase [Haloferacaceae archaeon]